MNEKLLSDYIDIATKIIADNYNPDNCIVSARIAMEVFDNWHLKVKPLTVKVSIFNKLYSDKGAAPADEEEAKKWIDEGAWSVIVGDRTEKNPQKWHGHLVSLIDKYMIDTSVIQANRPNKNILVDPIVAELKDSEFKSGKNNIVFNMNGSTMFYTVFPDDTSFMKHKDWWDVHACKNVVKDIISEMNRRKKK